MKIRMQLIYFSSWYFRLLLTNIFIVISIPSICSIPMKWFNFEGCKRQLRWYFLAEVTIQVDLLMFGHSESHECYKKLWHYIMILKYFPVNKLLTWSMRIKNYIKLQGESLVFNWKMFKHWYKLIGHDKIPNNYIFPI